MIKVEHNTETGEVTEIEMTSAEIKQAEKDTIDAAKREKAFDDKVNAKAALLERLGLTAEEASVLLA
jgi:hypothetical protein